VPGLRPDTAVTHPAANGHDSLPTPADPVPTWPLRRELARSSAGASWVRREIDAATGVGPVTEGHPTAVPIPRASHEGGADATMRDIAELADRVYDLLVRRLTIERERQGLSP
jgi:hypothetical protein